MEYRTVKLGSIDYTSGQKKTFEISRDGVMIGMNIRLRYTVTEGNTAALAGARFQTLARLIRRLDLVVGGRDTVISQPGELLAARATYERGVVPDGMEDTVVLTQNVATSYDVTIPVDFFLPRSVSPLTAALDLRRVTQSTIEITWANSDGSDLFNTAADCTISAVTCDVYGKYLLDVPNDQRFNVRELFTIDEDYSAASQNMAVTLDGRTSRLIRSVGLATLDDQVGSNALLNSIRLESGAFKWHDWDGPALQADNKSEFHTAIIAGWHYMPATALGRPELMINTSPNVRSADVQAILDVTTGSGSEKALFSVEGVRPLIVS